MEHDEAWQDAAVERELQTNWWLHASIPKRVAMTLGFSLLGAAMGAGIGWADGSGWLPWTLVGTSVGLVPLLLWSRRFLAWNIRQNYATDEVLRRGATAVQRDGIRTDSAVGKKSPPYWPQAPKD